MPCAMISWLCLFDHHLAAANQRAAALFYHFDLNATDLALPDLAEFMQAHQYTSSPNAVLLLLLLADDGHWLPTAPDNTDAALGDLYLEAADPAQKMFAGCVSHPTCTPFLPKQHRNSRARGAAVTGRRAYLRR